MQLTWRRIFPAPRPRITCDVMKIEYQLLHTNRKYVCTCNLHEGVIFPAPRPRTTCDVMKMEYQLLHTNTRYVLHATYMKALYSQLPVPVLHVSVWRWNTNCYTQILSMYYMQLTWRRIFPAPRPRITCEWWRWNTNCYTQILSMYYLQTYMNAYIQSSPSPYYMWVMKMEYQLLHTNTKYVLHATYMKAYIPSSPTPYYM